MCIIDRLWIAEISKKALKAAGEEFAVPNATTDYKVMLEDPALDAVVVSTPPTTHAPIGIAVMRAGKHLMLKNRSPTLFPMHANCLGSRKNIRI